MRRLCLFSGGFAMAAALYLFLLHGAPGVLLAALAAACILLFLLRGPYARRAAVCVLGLLAGFAWCRGYEALFLRPFAALSSETTEVSAQALAAPQTSSYGQSVSARLTLDGKSCTAVIYFDEADGEIVPGSLLSGTAKLTTAQEKHARGNDYDLSRGVFLTASCRGALHAEPGRAPAWLAPALLAERLRAAIRSAFPADTAGFVQALLLGDKTGLSYADKNDLAIAGIYHAVAVSGMHVSILLGMILLLCGGNHRLAAALGLPAAAFFIIMTGAPASAVRAGVMQALVLCAPLVRRENDPPTTICAALLVLLAQNPWALLNVGLQLSFASTAGIVFFAGGLYRSLSENRLLARLLRPKNVCSALVRAMLTALCCTISSMVFALPITALQFGTVSLAAPVVNVLALWMLSIVFCAGLLTALLALALPAAAGVCAWALSWPVRLVLLIVHGAAKLPFAALYLENGYLIAAAVFLYGLALLLALRPRAVQFWQAAAAAVLVTACCMGLSCADYALPEACFSMLDVGQGQCLVSRSGKSVSVIDCGGQEDASGEAAARFLLARGVTQVDRLILTHFDADHCNGVRQLLRRVRVKTLYVPDVSPENNLRTKILFAAAQAGAEIRFVTNDLTLPDGMRMFAPTGSAEESNTGLCVLAAGEKYDILVTGDLSEQAEYRLLSTHALPRAAVLVAGHHGAATSTSEALLRAIRPEAVFISVGADNRFGHPADETLRRIEKAGAAVCRTDLSGTITIRG